MAELPSNTAAWNCIAGFPVVKSVCKNL